MLCPQCRQQIPTGQTVCPVCQVDILDMLGTYAPFAALEPGQTLMNRYAIVRYLGRGAMGMVYHARDQVLDLNVAIKVLLPEVAGDRRAIAALKHEARTAMGLSHPSIMRVHQFEETQGHSFLVMELIDGPTLADVLGQAPAGKLSLDDVVRYSQQICEGLAYAHSRGVFHRDLKPANIMLTRAGEVKVTDFGLAWVVQERLSRLSGRPPVGTLAYMAPEQALGDKGDKRSDIYALGCVLYELLSGDPPFVRGDITYQHRYKPPAPLAGLPDGVNTVLLTALAKDPTARWQSALEMQTALVDRRAGGPAGSMREAAPAQQRRRWAWHSVRVREAAPAQQRPSDLDGREQQRQGVLEKMLGNSIGMPFVLIPAGTFQMGSNDCDADDNEKPVHTVRITQPFYLGQYEVTDTQWYDVMRNNSHGFRVGDVLNQPVDIIRNNDIMGGTQHYQNQGLLRRGDTDVLLPRSQTEPSGSACLHQFRPQRV